MGTDYYELENTAVGNPFCMAIKMLGTNFGVRVTGMGDVFWLSIKMRTWDQHFNNSVYRLVLVFRPITVESIAIAVRRQWSTLCWKRGLGPPSQRFCSGYFCLEKHLWKLLTGGQYSLNTFLSERVLILAKKILWGLKILKVHIQITKVKVYSNLTNMLFTEIKNEYTV